MVGVPPFYCDDKQLLYIKIRSQNPNFCYGEEPINISDAAKDLLNSLLMKNPQERIKPNDIPTHPWFNEINFDDVYNLKIKSPFVPSIKGIEDYSNIDPTFLTEEVNSPVKKRVSKKTQKLIEDSNCII